MFYEHASKEQIDQVIDNALYAMVETQQLIKKEFNVRRLRILPNLFILFRFITKSHLLIGVQAGSLALFIPVWAL
jgi:hypothetical protein